MKKRIKYVLIALFVGTQVYSINKISNLESEIRNINSTISSINNNLSQRIDSIYYNVAEQLEEEASVIHSASIFLGEFDVDKIAVPINFTVVPKQVTDSTAVYLKFNDETIQLEKEDDTYKGSKSFNISEEEIIPDIIIEDNGVKTITQDERICIYNLIGEFIPRLYPTTSCVSTSSGSDIIKYKLDGELFIDGDYDDFKKIQYVTYIDEEKVDEATIDSSKFTMVENTFVLDKTFKLKEGQILTTYVVGLDNLGFTHHYPIEHYEAGSDLQREPYYDVVRITDKNGEIIYDNVGNGKYEEEYGYEVEVVYP